MLLNRAAKQQSLFATAFTPTFARRSSPFFFPSPATAFLPASALLVYRCPRAPLRFLAAHTALFVTAFNLRCPAFLLRCIFSFASSRHRIPPFFLLKKSHSRPRADLFCQLEQAMRSLSRAHIKTYPILSMQGGSEDQPSAPFGAIRLR